MQARVLAILASISLGSLFGASEVRAGSEMYVCDFQSYASDIEKTWVPKRILVNLERAEAKAELELMFGGIDRGISPEIRKVEVAYNNRVIIHWSMVYEEGEPYGTEGKRRRDKKVYYRLNLSPNTTTRILARFGYGNIRDIRGHADCILL